VIRRDPRRSAVEIEVRVIVEAADLGITELVDPIACADCQIAAADSRGRLENDASMSGPVQLICRDEPADAGTENRNRARLCGRRAVERRELSARDAGDQSERERSAIDGRRSPDAADQVEKLPSRDSRVRR
jgi:hypothetical protein